MKLKAADIIEVLEKWAPPALQEEWDNSGYALEIPVQRSTAYWFAWIAQTR